MATVISKARMTAEQSEALRTQFRGELIRPEDPGYDDARRVYDGGIDRHPALVARVVDVGDVMAALRAGREAGLPIAVRGGGHHGAGFGTVDDGMVIDLGRLKGIRVDLSPGQQGSSPGASSPTSTMRPIRSDSPCPQGSSGLPASPA